MKKRLAIALIVCVLLLAVSAIIVTAALNLQPVESPLISISDPYSAQALVQVPPGYRASVYAANVPASQPTVITFNPAGVLVMLTLNGSILELQDIDGDFVVDKVTPLLEDSASDSRRTQLGLAQDILKHAVGLAYSPDGTMYISDSGRISTLTDTNNDGFLDTLTPIVEGLVTLRTAGNSNNGIAFGPDGKLYVGVGATTDHGPLKEPMEAVILRMNPDGSDLEVFASGLRNPYDLAFTPDGDLFTADNNPSIIDQQLPYLLPEELNHIRQGLNYGFPDSYGRMISDGSEPPVTEFYPSVASSGLTFAGTKFPEPFANGLFVAQWGTGSDDAISRNIDNGYAVVFVPLDEKVNGTFHSDWLNFADFSHSEQTLRPIDVTMGPDGALYIAEFMTSTVIRVTYTGEVEETAEPVPTTVPVVYEFDPALVKEGERLFTQGFETAPACVTCHVLAPGTTGLGPSLRGLGQVAGSRVVGLDAQAYVRQSVLQPNAFIVPGFNADYMFQAYPSVLNEQDLSALIAFVLTLQTAP